MTTHRRDDSRSVADPRDALAAQIAAELTASDKTYRKRAVAAGRPDDPLMQVAS